MRKLLLFTPNKNCYEKVFSAFNNIPFHFNRTHTRWFERIQTQFRSTCGNCVWLWFFLSFLAKKIGFQITGIPILSTNQITTSSGLSFLLKINDFSKLSLYSYLGNHLRYERYNYSDPTNEYYQKVFSYYSAIGVGVRINFLQVLDFNFQAGYSVGFRNSSSTFPYEPEYNDYNTTLDVGAGLYFHF